MGKLFKASVFPNFGTETAVDLTLRGGVIDPEFHQEEQRYVV